jgi:hypothetical protein
MTDEPVAVPPPPQLQAMRLHMRGCHRCHTGAGCRTGLRLVRVWMDYEARRRDAARTASPH